MEKIWIDWDTFGAMVNELVNMIKERKCKFDGVYGIPRGGLCLAVALSHRLNLPLLLYPTKKSLVVDDISDTGKTLASFKNRKIATLFNTQWTMTKPNWFVEEKCEKSDWIVFPWETE